MQPETTYIYTSNTSCSNFIKGKTLEIRTLLGLLLLINLGLIIGNTPAVNLIFHPASVINGEWWRVLTWPFVHVSRYHLLLDATAFLLLYAGLKEAKTCVRISYVLGTFTGSLLLPLLIAPEISQIGLCGLSGPAHGLLAISALEIRQSTNEKKLGNLLLYGLLVKIGWEFATGTAFLQQLHFGNIGQPVVSTHAGGVIAGLFCYWITTLSRKTMFRQANKDGTAEEEM